MIRLLLATGRPALDAAIATDPEVEIVAQAYYMDAVLTALVELQPDAAVVDPRLPGSERSGWFGEVTQGTPKVVWLGRSPSAAASGALGPNHVELRAPWNASAILAAVRSAVLDNGDAARVDSAFASAGVHAFLGCLPRLGVTTATVAFATAAARRGERVAVVDANFTHPCVPDVLGLTPPEAGWDVSNDLRPISGADPTAHGVSCLALSRTLSGRPGSPNPYDRLGCTVQSLRDRGFSVVAVDLGAPRALESGRLARWLDWLVSAGASANLVLAQDPQALLAAARVLRTAEAAGVTPRLWCACYDAQISSIAEIAKALGRPCDPLPWDRHAVVRCALAGKPPTLRLPLSVAESAGAPVFRL